MQRRVHPALNSSAKLTDPQTTEELSPVDRNFLSMIKTVWPQLAIVGVSFALFGVTVGFPFINFDDHSHLLLNTSLNPPTWEGLIRHWTTAYFSLYIPVSYTGWWILSWISHLFFGEIDPTIFHFANVLLHSANSILVFLILRVVLTGTSLAAFFGALFFCIHPIQVESVAWVSEFRGLLASTLSLGAAYLFLQKEKGWMTRFVAPALYLISLLAKPATAPLPLALLVLRWLQNRNLEKREIRELGLWLVGASPLLYSILSLQPAHERSFDVPWLDRPHLWVDTTFFYLQKIIWPDYLSIDFGRNLTQVFSQSASYFASLWLGMGVTAWGALKLWQRAPFLLGGLIVGAILILPVSGVVPFEFQEVSTVANRYAYLSMIGYAILIAGIFHQLSGRGGPKRRFIVVGTIVAMSASFATASWYQLQHYATPDGAFHHVLKHNPRSFLAHSKVGSEWLARRKFSKAEFHFAQALRYHPNDPRLIANLGHVKISQRKIGIGIAYLREAVKGDRAFTLLDTRIRLVQLLAVLGRREEARRYVDDYLSARPGDPRRAELIQALRPARMLGH